MGQNQCLGPTGSWENNYCSANAVLRYMTFSNGNDYYEYLDNYYWSLDKESYTCYYQYNFNLPVYIVTAASIKWIHALTAFQVGIHQENWDSWIFFQYDDSDIHPGEWQLPVDPDENGRGLRVAIGRPREDIGIIEGHGYVNDEIVQFMIQPDGSIVNINL
mgnify:CR=1 FL=1